MTQSRDLRTVLEVSACQPPGGHTHHQRDHNRKAVGDLICRLDQDDCEADGHPYDPTQKGCRTDQGKGPGVEVAQSDVAGEEKQSRAQTGNGRVGSRLANTWAPVHSLNPHYLFKTLATKRPKAAPHSREGTKRPLGTEEPNVQHASRK